MIRERYVWGENDVEMKEFIKQHIASCVVCARSKVPHHNAGRGHILQTGEHPMDILGADVYKPGRDIKKVGKDKEGFDSILSFACYFSRHIIAVATKGDPTSKEIVDILLNEVIRHYGVPSEIRSDQGSNFVSRAIRLLYARYGIRISHGTAYHHRTIGLVERWHSCVKALLLSERFAVGKDASSVWTDYLPIIQLAFNATVNATTGFSPFFVVHGRHCRLPFDSVVGSRALPKELPDWVTKHLERLGVVYDAVAAKLKLNALHRQKVFDLRRDVRVHYREGDKVLLLKGSVVDKKITKTEYATDGPYLGPYVIHQAAGKDNYYLRDFRTRRLKQEPVNVERLFPYPTPPAPHEREGDRYPVRCVVGRRTAKLESADHAAGLAKGDEVVQYRLRWVGYPSSADVWRSWHYLGDIKELVDAYDQRQGRPVEQAPTHSRDSAALPQVAADAKAQRRKHFRRRPHNKPEPQGKERQELSDPAPVAEEVMSTPVVVPPAVTPSPDIVANDAPPSNTATRLARLERRRVAREQQLSSALSVLAASFSVTAEHGTSICSGEAPRAIDLCAGCGGLALAARQLGYHHAVLVETSTSCTKTLIANGFNTAITARLQDMVWKGYGEIELLTAGPPCQPWSLGGVNGGANDDRNIWGDVVRAVRELRPRLFLFEMVAGFLQEQHTETREQVVDGLKALGYTVKVVAVNTASVGLPQSRKRCFFMGSTSMTSLRAPEEQECVTLREAFQSLGAPNGVNRHEIHGVAQSYKGHQPSRLDSLARTLRAGNAGPGGGDNTLRLDDGSIRYFTIREMARLQGFPDDHVFDPVWSRAVAELGNACPPPLARAWLTQLQLAASLP
jgi:DNA (cytosine-5)-methyltransferase 1